ncbi:MAG: hypothetical protein GY856_28405 [bacterium]|nr:hypothetical protein [bacterium]
MSAKATRSGPVSEEDTLPPDVQVADGKATGYGRIHHGAVLLLVSLSLWISVYALLLAFSDTFRLREHLGTWSWPVVVGLLAAAVASLLSYFRYLKAWREGRWRDRSGLPFRLWLYALVAGSCLYLVLFQEYNDLTIVVVLGLAAGVHSLVLGVVAARDLPTRTLVRRLDLVVFNLCALLVATEIGLRLTANVRPNVLLEREDSTAAERIRRTRLRPGAMRYGFPVNSEGYYDSEFQRKSPDEKVVLSIADSFSVAPVPHYYHFTTVAERELPGVQLYNMGVSAIGPREYYYLLFNEGLALNPDVIVVNAFAGNDFIEMILKVDQSDLLKHFFDRKNLLVYQVPRRLRIMFKEGLLLGEAPPADDHAGAGRISAPAQMHAAFPRLLDPSREKAPMSDQRYLQIAQRRATLASRQSTQAYELKFESFRRMREAAGETPFLIVIIPDEYQIDDEIWSGIRAKVPGPLFRDQTQRVLGQWLLREGIPFLDLLPVLRAVPPLEDGKRHLYHHNDTHWNRRGNEVAGEAIARFVKRYL